MKLDDKLHILVELVAGKIVKAYADPHTEVDLVVFNRTKLKENPLLDPDKLNSFVNMHVEELGLTEIAVLDFCDSCENEKG